MRREIIFLIVLILANVCLGATITVNWDGTGDYLTIQEGIDAAVDGDEVVVADGTYTVEEAEYIDFLGKAITVRSENGLENCIVNSAFIFGDWEGTDSVLKGFQIINSTGVSCSWSSTPTIEDCLFIQNNVGINCGPYGSPRINNCVFENNSWGVNASMDSYPIIKNCQFKNNTVYAVTINEGKNYCRIENCLFSNNRIGINCYSDTDAVIKNCIFEQNNEKGVYCHILSDPVIMNCTFVQNGSEEGGGVYCDLSSPKITNCVFLENLPQQIFLLDTSSAPTVSYSNIQGGWDGEGNIDADPEFAEVGYWDPNDTPENPNDDFWVDGDYHLKSQGGRWSAESNAWVIDEVTSPCIDAGDPLSPIGLEPFPHGGFINMGAYGGTEKASKSYFGTEPCETIIAGDINGDCAVNLLDFSIMALHWLGG